MLVTTAMINGKVSANDREDGNSVVEMASFMKENFHELFRRLDQLESKENRSIGKESCESGQTGSGRAIQIEDDSLAGTGGGTVDSMSGLNETRLEASLKEVDRLQKLLSDRKFFSTSSKFLKFTGK